MPKTHIWHALEERTLIRNGRKVQEDFHASTFVPSLYEDVSPEAWTEFEKFVMDRKQAALSGQIQQPMSDDEIRRNLISLGAKDLTPEDMQKAMKILVEKGGVHPDDLKKPGFLRRFFGFIGLDRLSRKTAILSLLLLSTAGGTFGLQVSYDRDRQNIADTNRFLSTRHEIVKDNIAKEKQRKIEVAAIVAQKKIDVKKSMNDLENINIRLVRFDRDLSRLYDELAELGNSDTDMGRFSEIKSEVEKLRSLYDHLSSQKFSLEQQIESDLYTIANLK